MQIYQFKPCARTTRKQQISDKSLIDAVDRAERGQIDADLGRDLLKQRIARPGAGKSGGFCLLVAYKAGVRAVFLFSFAKNEKDNLSPKELASMQDQAEGWLSLSASQIERALSDGKLVEVRKSHE